jgi:DNA repair protein SbcC/Rad50
MLTRIELTGYQSHRRTRIDLGLFTVVTGPSNSGKSSVIRAARLVARNAKGVAYIRQGDPHAAVALVDEEAGTRLAVLVKRTRKRGGDLYRLLRQTPEGRDQQEYTKLGGQVPADVAKVLRLGPENFAGQFDGPYLLGETGSDIAKVLGALTNVDMVLRAAAEGGRRRKGHDRDLKAAQARKSALEDQLAGYAGVEDQLAAAIEAEQEAEKLVKLTAEHARLQTLITRARQAGAAAEAAQRAADLAAPPDLAQIERALKQLTRLTELSAAYHDAEVEAEQWAAEATLAGEAHERAHQALHEALVAAGTCPLCEQEVAA